jgi:cephalosporin-C deacetylase-like acetyl esterase
MRFLLAVSLCSLLPAVLCAQDRKDPKPGDVMIEKFLAAETDKLSAKFLDGAKTIDEWKQKRPRLYQEYMDMLGLWPIPEKTPLKATKTGEIEAHGVVVEKVHFQSKPGLYVTANVYRPLAKEKKKLPAIVYVCGHSWKGRDGNKSAHQDHGFWYANNGYVCIILDTLQLGEIPGVHHGTYGTPWRHIGSYKASGERKLPENIPENRFWWHSIGYSPAAVECWNGVRAIDYLCTRPDVDPARIGVTGISGGGAATFWIAAADERVKVAVPVSGMADLEFYVKNKGINSHCDCMFLHNTYQWDWTTIAALVAPRPMLFANSDKDAIFPMDANRRVITKLKKIYTMHEQPNLVDEYVSVGDHAYRPDLRVAIFRFFNKHLKGDTTSKVEDCVQYTPLKGRDLRIFPEDADLPKDALNARIDETFIPAAKMALPEKGNFAEWKKATLGTLREKVFRNLPVNIPEAQMTILPATNTTEPLIRAFMVAMPGAAKAKSKSVLLYVVRDDDLGFFFIDSSPLHDGPSGVLYPRGTRSTADMKENPVLSWTDKSPPNFVERSHLLLGRTVDEGRVRDIAASAKLLDKSQKEKRTLTVVGKGQSGILAAYAALFEPSIKEVIIVDPPKSHKEGPHFLNVLRVLDIPEALGLLAPTPLTIIGGQDRAFDRTAEIYRLAGAADKLMRK